MNLEGMWIEKYRPKTLNALCISDDIKEQILDFGKNIPNLLFIGNPGTGKTTLAQIIVKDILDCDYLYINASDENGIDTVRTKIMGFAQTKSFDGGLKVVILDECLEENTPVHVYRDGKDIKISIKDVNPDSDLVKSYSIKNDRVEYRPFEIECKGERDVYELELSNGDVVICTDTHKWYVEFNGEVVRMPLSDIMKNNIREILSI